MRISVNRDDPGFTDRASECEIYLDGVKITHCITADEELGKAECYKLNEWGNPFISEANPGEFETETRRGVVHVVVPFGFRPAKK
jgi:hypothetical protein